MNKNMITKIFLGLAVILFVLSVIIYIKIVDNKNKAKDIAINYLQTAYAEHMNPIKVRLSLMDPAMYHVYFTPQNNSELSFEVLVMLDFALPRGNPDNYLLKYFEFHLAKDMQNIIDDLGRGEIITEIIVLHQPLYSFNVPETLKEDMPYREMESYIDYELRFDVDRIWKETDKYAEACMMLEMIESIRASGCTPERITFSYQYANKERNKFITFYEWDNIDNVLQIEGLMN